MSRVGFCLVAIAMGACQTSAPQPRAVSASGDPAADEAIDAAVPEATLDAGGETTPELPMGPEEVPQPNAPDEMTPSAMDDGASASSDDAQPTDDDGASGQGTGDFVFTLPPAPTPVIPSIGCGVVESCNGRDDDCDDEVDEGGVCPSLLLCAEDTGNCDGDRDNGCETSLNTNSNCGACGRSCPNLTGVGVVCNHGTCETTVCLPGYSSCEDGEENGCELRHHNFNYDRVVACNAAPSVGSACADIECGFLCLDEDEWDQVGRQRGNRSRFFRARMLECSDCGAELKHRLRLDVPPGINYDLFVWRGSCEGEPMFQSTNPTGQAEELTVRRSDSNWDSQNTNYYIEVRYIGGHSCEDWTIDIQAPEAC